MINKVIKSLEHVPPNIIKKKLTGVLWEGTPESGSLALTFDDGPDPEITPLVLDALDSAGARGTFFMLGRQAKKHPETARMVIDRGHTVGNHSMNHPGMFLMIREDVAREIDDAQKAISDAAGAEPKWFRPPYGIFDFTGADVVKSRGMSLVLWTVLSGDYSGDPPGTIIKTVEPFIRPGAIMVFHDTVQGGGSDLAGIIDKICIRAADAGIRCGGVDKLSVSDFMVDDDKCD